MPEFENFPTSNDPLERVQNEPYDEKWAAKAAAALAEKHQSGAPSPEAAEYTRRLAAESNYRAAVKSSNEDLARAAVDGHYQKTTAENIHTAAFAVATDAGTPDAGPESDFDSTSFAESIGIDPAAFAEMGLGDADAALSQAREAISEFMDTADISVTDAIKAMPRPALAELCKSVEQELDRLSSPYYGLAGERTPEQLGHAEAAVLNVLNLAIAHEKAGTKVPPFDVLVARARLVQDNGYSPGKRGAAPPVVAPANSFQSIHHALQANPW